jgi:hypothetical protein
VKGPVTVTWHAPVFEPDLVVQSLTASDYYPVIGESISVTLIIENLGNAASGSFWTDLFENESVPPTPPVAGDYYWRTSLQPGQRDTCTFSDITCTSSGTWRMYGLTDSNDEIEESNESNNVRGPVNVYWQAVQERPDLVVEEFCIGNEGPEVGDTVHVMVTIRNQGQETAYSFFSSLFYDESFPPYPPSLGDDYVYLSWLHPGETYHVSFYIGNDYAEDWDMYFLVDSYDAVYELDEDNNVLGPEYVTWSYPAKQGPISRYNIMLTAWEYDNVEWVCAANNAAPVSQCSIWTCDYNIDSTYEGVPYLWGGDRYVQEFLNNLANSYRAGAHMGNDCLTGDFEMVGNVCWATGIDCSGFVSRCWWLSKHSTLGLISPLVSTRIRYDQLMQGDALDDTSVSKYGRHVVLFYRRLPADTLEVYEARSYGAPPQNPDSNLVQNRKYVESYFDDRDYYSIHYNNIIGDPPLVPGDCNGDDKVTGADVVYLLTYLYRGGYPPAPLCIGNVNEDGIVSGADVVYLMDYLYRNGPEPQNGCD